MSGGDSPKATVIKTIVQKNKENVNLTHIIHKHTDYCTKMKEVLTAINLSQPHTYEVI